MSRTRSSTGPSISALTTLYEYSYPQTPSGAPEVHQQSVVVRINDETGTEQEYFYSCQLQSNTVEPLFYQPQSLTFQFTKTTAGPIVCCVNLYNNKDQKLASRIVSFTCAAFSIVNFLQSSFNNFQFPTRTISYSNLSQTDSHCTTK